MCNMCVQMHNALWYGVPVQVVRHDGNWALVRILRKCTYFAAGRQVYLDAVNITQYDPVPVRAPVVYTCARTSLV